MEAPPGFAGQLLTWCPGLRVSLALRGDCAQQNWERTQIPGEGSLSPVLGSVWTASRLRFCFHEMDPIRGQPVGLRGSSRAQATRGSRGTVGRSYVHGLALRTAPRVSEGRLVSRKQH